MYNRGCVYSGAGNADYMSFVLLKSCSESTVAGRLCPHPCKHSGECGGSPSFKKDNSVETERT